MGTGVGEAMLIGAATGAGTSAITGQDPLKGAMFGALGGAVMPGIGQALGGSAAGAGSATAAQTAGQLGVQGASSAAGSQAAQLAAQNAGFGQAGLEATRAAAATALNPASQAAQLAAQESLFTGGAGLPIAQAPLPSIADVPKTGFLDIFKGAEGGPDFGTRIGNFIAQNPGQAAMLGGTALNTLGNVPGLPEEEKYRGPLSRFSFNPDTYTPYRSTRLMADGGIADLPVSKKYMEGGHLGSYSDGGRLLKGPGDGMSDSIPAKIGKKQPARLADGEFVVPADVVSGLGNGSTDAGAKQLYAMMDKVRHARTGNKKQGKEINPRKYLPA